MSREAVFTVFLLLSLLVVHTQSAKTVSAGRTWVVDDDGPADFHTIQGAVEGASSGDIVFVRSGIYFEHVSVTKSISLVSENPFDTIIDVQGAGTSVIFVDADGVTVRNFTLCNSVAHWVYGEGAYRSGGVYLYFSNGCTVENCIIIGNHNGVSLCQSSYNNIFSNLMTDNIEGVVVWNSSSNNLIKGNWVLNTSGNGDGIFIEWYTSNNTITENYCDFADASLIIRSPSSGVVYHNNFMSNAPPVIDAQMGGLDFAWSKNGEGNFWMGYSGADADGDGFGDTPYLIPYLSDGATWTYGSTNDSYPLMKPYNWIRGDVNYDAVVNILDLFAIARAFDSRPGDTRWSPRCDLNNDGTIDILDIFEVASRFMEKTGWPPP
jgi:parallel beta-helix repeat protein